MSAQLDRIRRVQNAAMTALTDAADDFFRIEVTAYDFTDLAYVNVWFWSQASADEWAERLGIPESESKPENVYTRRRTYTKDDRAFGVVGVGELELQVMAQERTGEQQP